MNTIADLHSRMTDLLAGCADDAAKLDEGNAAAGRRLRKALKALKDLTKETRKTSIDVGKAGGAPTGTSDSGSATCGEGKPVSECCGGAGGTGGGIIGGDV